MQGLPKLSNRTFVFAAVLLLGLCFFARANLKASGPATGFYFLDVGQGDSELAIAENGAKILTDAGQGSRVVGALGKILGSADKYIDLVLISHPQLDHYGGMRYVLDSYDLGAVLTNGREPQVISAEWADMKKKLSEKNVPMITIGKGDSIKLGEDGIRIISPDKLLLAGKDENEAALVQKMTVGGVSALFTGDIGKKTEARLSYNSDLRSDILKIAHHGSKYSVSAQFLDAVKPILAVIEVGKNSYGHPSKEALRSLADNDIPVLRTDLFGTVSALFGAGELKISTEKGK
ncbi:MAG: competence protein ComEC [Parcubacteria group bacterium LiPW_15]|nr:MAG: competence protein ComEC [Parcubacteria group bacterium LiPW_15]